MKKVLFVATVTSHINAFHTPYLKWFKEHGYEVHVASNGNELIEYCDKHYNLNFTRFPIKIQNLKAYRELKKIIKENNYQIIHCHTPVASAVARIAAKTARKKYNTKIIYTAHGFHFYKGAPIINWIIYYPIEKFLSKYTDVLITINKEDYDRAKRKLKKIKNIKYVHGVGFDSKRLDSNEKEDYRKELECEKDDIILSYVAEINSNKNQKLLINCLESLINTFPNLKLLLIGQDSTNGKIEKLILKKKLKKYIKLLGNRNDIGEILSATDIYLASSIREGLPVNVMEAMYKGLPVIALNNRGHRELIINGKNGIIVENENMMIEKITEIILDKQKRVELGKNAKDMVEIYKIENVINEITAIYEEEIYE